MPCFRPTQGSPTTVWLWKCSRCTDFYFETAGMRVFQHLDEITEPSHSSAVTIGNFDGVHLGHQALLASTVTKARALGAVSTAITFEPHPLRLLAPEHAPKLLTTLDRKIRLIGQTGIQALLVLPFDAQLSCLSPHEFVNHILVEKLHATSVHVGPNFRFGHRHAGDVKLLGEMAAERGFSLDLHEGVKVRGEWVSSSRIRELVSEGRLSKAGRMLSRPFSLSGPIVHGSGIGRSQTVPTLNLAPREEQLPRNGVYVTRTRANGDQYDSVSNVGHRPTFGEHPITIESYLLSFTGTIQATRMEVEFLHRLRDEAKFPDAAALKAQIQRDVRHALQYFRLLRLFRSRQG